LEDTLEGLLEAVGDSFLELFIGNIFGLFYSKSDEVSQSFGFVTNLNENTGLERENLSGRNQSFDFFEEARSFFEIFKDDRCVEFIDVAFRNSINRDTVLSLVVVTKFLQLVADQLSVLFNFLGELHLLRVLSEFV